MSRAIAARLRWVAWLDLLVTGVFVIPSVAVAAIALLMRLEVELFGPARAAPLPAAPWSIFISLMGVLGVLWAVARLIVMDDRLCLLDAVARMVVAALILYGLVKLNLPLIFIAFIVTEILGTVVTALLWRRSTKAI